jgi:hypothetical protein
MPVCFFHFFFVACLNKDLVDLDASMFCTMQYISISICLYIYISTHTHIHIHTHMYVHTYIHKESAREREREGGVCVCVSVTQLAVCNTHTHTERERERERERDVSRCQYVLYYAPFYLLCRIIIYHKHTSMHPCIHLYDNIYIN